MTVVKNLIDEHLRGKSIDKVSRLFFPRYWKLADAKEADKQRELEEALTIHDRPCMSYFRE